MSEESRLGREQIETAYALKQITDAGVRVFFYLEDRERTLDSALEKVMLSLTNFAAEVERERAKQRTYDALLRKAKAGHVTGGRVYGYDNREIATADGQRLHVIRVINQEQAATVRRVFEMYASKIGLTRIAKTLNAEGVPSPRGIGQAGPPSAIREMLYRPLYRGEIVWNEYQKIERGGTKRRRRRESGELIKLEAPDLRIISDELWQRVTARLKQVQNVFVRKTSAQGQLLGRPAMRDFDSPYLLSGLARCRTCGGQSMPVAGIVGESDGTYGCAYHRKRGASICKNALRIDQDVLDTIVLQAMSEALDERLTEVAIEKALARIRAGDETRLSRKSLVERELSLIEAHESNLVDAIARGENMDPLLAKLRAEEQRKKQLIEELSHLMRPASVVEIDEARIKRELQDRVKDTKNLLGRHPAQARQMLRKLLEEPLMCEAFEENGRKGYKVTGRGSYLRLLPSQLATPCVVSPTGFEPVLLP
jgi:site-specific DNA recombinase